jgi:hypothetical protein
MLPIHRFGRQGVRVGGMIVVLALLLMGMGGTERAQEFQPPPPTLESKAVLLWVRVGANVTKQDIENNLKLSLDEGSFSWGAVDIEPVPRQTYEFMEKVLRGGETPRVAPPAAAVGEVQLRELSTGEWEVRLEEPTQSLEKMEVHFQDKETPQVFERGAVEQANRPTLIRPGVYAIRLGGEQPTKYVATIANRGVKQDKPLEGTWPKRDRYYAIALKQFEGKQEELLEVLRGKGGFLSEPFVDLKPTEKYTLAFASWKTDAASAPDPVFVDNSYTPHFRGIRGKKTKRVWLLFPLTQQDAEKLSRQYAGYGTIQMMEEINNEKPFNKAPASAELTVDGTTPAHWFELSPRDKDGEQIFTRSIPLKEWTGLHNKYPSFWQLVVWEFDTPGMTPQAIRVEHPDPKRGRVFALENEIEGLSIAVSALAKKEKTDAPLKPGEKEKP